MQEPEAVAQILALARLSQAANCVHSGCVTFYDDRAGTGIAGGRASRYANGHRWPFTEDPADAGAITWRRYGACLPESQRQPDQATHVGRNRRLAMCPAAAPGARGLVPEQGHGPHPEPHRVAVVGLWN